MTLKLSTTQHDAIVEVSELGYTVAKANTIKSLEDKGLIDAVGATHHKLTSKGRAVLGLPVETFHEKLMEDVAELESALQGDPWKMGEQITADEPYLEFEEPLADWERELLSDTVQADTFDNSLPDALKVSLGFAATLEWRNTKVWDGLTAEEIREDMDTRFPFNRADRRAHIRAYRRAAKQLVGAL